MGLEKNDARKIREIVGELLEEEGLGGLRKLVLIKESWRELVGDEKAEVSTPYRLEKGRLYVGVTSHAWIQELHYCEREMEEKIKERLGIEIDAVIFKKLNLK
jgi:predicted nucleic acid-binding Zn ribbon protein